MRSQRRLSCTSICAHALSTRFRCWTSRLYSATSRSPATTIRDDDEKPDHGSGDSSDVARVRKTMSSSPVVQGGGRTSRRRCRQRAGLVEQAQPLGDREPVEPERRHLAVRSDGQRKGSRALVPVGALEDPRLAFEPQSVRLLDVLATRGEDVEHEAPFGLEEAARGAECTQLLLLCLHVQQRAERADDERNALGYRRLAQVAQAEVDAARDAGIVGRSTRDGEHRGRGVDADDVDARSCDRDGDAAGPTASSTTRDAGRSASST